jgi:hypothetical protein
MVCFNTSRLKIGPTPDAAGLGQSPGGKLIARFGGPRAGVTCVGRQSMVQWKKDISACGEKNSPSPWSSPRGEEITLAALAVHHRASTSGDQCLSAPDPFSGCVLSTASCDTAWFSASRRGTGGIPKESNQVQANAFHRRDAETMRRDCGVEEGARERVGVSGGIRRGQSNQKRLNAKGLRRKVGEGGGKESNQVQADAFFSRVLGEGCQPPPRSFSTK